MNEKRTVDTILQTMGTRVANKEVTPAWVWLEAAQSLQALLEGETDKLYEMQQVLAKQRVEFREKDMSVAEATLRVEATDEYREMQRQRAKIARVEEIGRIAKQQANMKDSQYRQS